MLSKGVPQASHKIAQEYRVPVDVDTAAARVKRYYRFISAEEVAQLRNNGTQSGGWTAASVADGAWVGEKATFTYSPHRVAGHNCLAVQVVGKTGTVNRLLTVTGSLRWPTMDDYKHGVRWYINMPDAVDVVYLVRELANLI